MTILKVFLEKNPHLHDTLKDLLPVEEFDENMNGPFGSQMMKVRTAYVTADEGVDLNGNVHAEISDDKMFDVTIHISQASALTKDGSGI